MNAGASGWVRDACAIVGIGETGYSKSSGMTTRALASAAIRRAVADAGMRPADIDGLLSHGMNDSPASNLVAADLGIRPNFFMDCIGGGASAEALIALAVGLIVTGQCRTVAVYRAMNGFSGTRTGGTNRNAIPVISGQDLYSRPFGWSSPAQTFAPCFMRHMHDFGTRSEQAAMVRVFQSEHAAKNPKALYRARVTTDDVLSSRMIATPLHLLDCCVETDSGTCLIITGREHAHDCRCHPVMIRSVLGRVCKPRNDLHFEWGPITESAAVYAKDRLWAQAGLGPDDVDVTAAYDAFTYTSLMLIEDYGFCAKGEGGDYVSDGRTRLGGSRPNNTSGGLLCEGYSNGMNLIIENVRQLRHDVDDGCPIDSTGRRVHTHDHSAAGGCRQVQDAEVAANLAWGNPSMGSAAVLVRG